MNPIYEKFAFSIARLIHVRGGDYAHIGGIHGWGDDICVEDLRAFLARRYAYGVEVMWGITDDELDHIIADVCADFLSSYNTTERNATMEKWIFGTNFMRHNANDRDFDMQLFDFDDIDSNIIREYGPDTIYVNGLSVELIPIVGSDLADGRILQGMRGIVS